MNCFTDANADHADCDAAREITCSNRVHGKSWHAVPGTTHTAHYLYYPHVFSGILLALLPAHPAVKLKLFH